MLRYLLFPEEQQNRSPNPLDDYSLANTKLLPANFGSIAQVNIFLGENNSGKSRFMREIMRSKDLRTIDSKELHSKIIKRLNFLENDLTNVNKDILLTISLIVTDTYEFRNETEIPELFSMDKYNSKSSIIKVSSILSKAFDLKSRLIKLFDSTENTVRLLFSKEIIDLNEEISSMQDSVDKLEKIFREISTRGRLGRNFGHHYIGNSYATSFNIGSSVITFDRYPWSDTYDEADRNQYSLEASQAVEVFQHHLRSLKTLIDNSLSSIVSPSQRTYIPTLRTARTLITLDGTRLESNNDIFLHTTIHDYNLNNTGVTVDTGFSLYDAIDTTRNARHEGRNSFKDFELFLSATFFNGKKVDVVAERVRDQRGGNILVAVEGVERDIHDLGDGIQTIIMLLYPLFIAPEKAWFFIEEPEVHLHPGFQRLFIETITTNKILRDKQLTIFLTTHSNHILDFALDDPHHVNIFTFRRREGTGNKSTYQIQLSSRRDIENLNLLGVQNSSVFLANCSIWVEGISDRLYFRAYLTAYLEHLATKESTTVSLLEGLHYTFLEYAGGNISHFDFTAQEGPFTTQTLENIKALSISNRIMLVADQDAGKDTRHQARTAQEHNGFKYVVLTSKEVENMLSPELISKGLTALFKTRTFDPNELTQADYRTKYLGTYLQTKYGGFPNTFLAQSGTIGSNYKRKFAEAIAPSLKWDEMSRTAQDFTKTLYDFIKYHNPRLGSN